MAWSCMVVHIIGNIGYAGMYINYCCEYKQRQGLWLYKREYYNGQTHIEVKLFHLEITILVFNSLQ